MCVVFSRFGVLLLGRHDWEQFSRFAKVLAEGKRPALMRKYIGHSPLDREDACRQVGF